MPNQCEIDNECLETEKCCEIIEAKNECSHKICIQPIRATSFFFFFCKI